MRFIDGNDDRIYTLQDIRNSWLEFKAEDPENHPADFRAEMLNVIMATINGRNDLDIIGLTPRETSNIVDRIRKVVL